MGGSNNDDGLNDVNAGDSKTKVDFSDAGGGVDDVNAVNSNDGDDVNFGDGDSKVDCGDNNKYAIQDNNKHTLYFKNIAQKLEKKLSKSKLIKDADFLQILISPLVSNSAGWRLCQNAWIKTKWTTKTHLDFTNKPQNGKRPGTTC